MGKVQKTIKALISKRFAAELQAVRAGEEPPRWHDSHILWAFFGACLAFAVLAVGILVPTVWIAVFSLAVAWVFWVLTLLVAFRDFNNTSSRVVATLLLSALAAVVLICVVRYRETPADLAGPLARIEAMVKDIHDLLSRPKEPIQSKVSQVTISPIDELTKLGWVVTSDSKNGTQFNFQQNSKPLPDMRRSEELLAMVQDHPFAVGIIGVSSLAGLSVLGQLKQMESLMIAGGDVGDLSELKSMRLIRSLNLSAVPAIDISPVGNLTQLRELKIQQPSSPLDIGSLKTLTKLEKFLVSNGSLRGFDALSGMKSLTSLDLTGTPVRDLSPIRDLPVLTDLRIDQRSIAGLNMMSGSKLKALHIIHDDGDVELIDLNLVVNLHDLQTLDLFPSKMIVLSPVRNMKHLTELTITGTPFTFGDIYNLTVHVQDPAAISELHNLKKLGMAWVDIQDIGFITGLDGLEEVYVDWAPVREIQPMGTLFSLRSVQLVGTGIVDITPLLNLTRLKLLTIQRTPARSDVVAELRRRGVVIKE